MVGERKSTKNSGNSSLNLIGGLGNILTTGAFEIIARVMGLFISDGRIDLSFRNAGTITLGDIDETPTKATLHRLGALLKLFRHPDLAVGECYVDKDWEVCSNDLSEIIGVLLRNDAKLEQTRPIRLINYFRDLYDAIFKKNNTERSLRNVSHHYDIGNDLYETFLDDEMIYSCAFFENSNQSLEEAQQNKLKITLNRLQITPEMKVLDLGCGWGAMTRAVAAQGASVVGITLANEQLEFAKQHIPTKLRRLIKYNLQDYRVHADQNSGTYDRIVSIGMFEHVGRRQYKIYFDAIQKLLKPKGWAVIHSIVKNTDSLTNAWLDKYIFPGGYIPRIEDMINSAAAANLKLVHKPFLHDGCNYAMTLRHWRTRFNNRFHELNSDIYDQRFWRMWNFYLAGSEAAFDNLGFKVSQIVLEKRI